MTTTRLINLLGSYKFATTNEALLQMAISQLLNKEIILFYREHHLGDTDRPDFYLPEYMHAKSGIVIEVKVQGSPAQVTRQLDRYAAYDAVTEILLLTTRSKHRVIAGELRGKKVHVLWIGGTNL